ncbi:MAG TPA: hypothetical protein VFE33_27640 [Thermoanaerobaculia bacterium]|nr:hypothetical protein [Thermoanaerobaculia bacterium]
MTHAVASRSRLLAVLLLLALPALGQARERNSKWTTPIRLAGVPGLARISPELYRAGQLTNEGVESLAKAPFRIRTVVSLRLFHNDTRRLSPGLLTRHGIHYDRIRQLAGFPLESEMVQFLGIVATAPKPILIHCNLGADRAGLLCAVYRVVFEGWTKDEAMAEMFGGDFHTSRFLGITEKHFFRKLDIAKLKRDAGLAASPPPDATSGRSPATGLGHQAHQAL